MLGEHMKEEFDQIVEIVEGRDWLFYEAEEEVLGATHANIGGWLLEKWQLPSQLVEPIMYHHDFHPVRTHADRTAVVHLADILVQENRLEDALSGFQDIAQLFPTAAKVPDSLYRVALIQIELGNTDGFPIGISIDFVLWPASSELREQDRKPIAVFLDGFEYHKDRIGHDLLQRQLLLASGRFDVWSLTWFDLDQALDIRTRTPVNVLHPDLGKLRQRFKQFGLAKWFDIADQSTFKWLLSDLGSAKPAPWENIGKAMLASRMSPATSS